MQTYKYTTCVIHSYNLPQDEVKIMVNANSEDEALEKGNALAEERYGITEGAFTTVTQVAK